MKRKFLEDMGLAKEQVDSIMDENGKDIEEAKGSLEQVKTELKQTKDQLTERDTQLENLKKTSGDNEALQKQITDLQAENKAAKEKHEADMKELKFSTAIRLALGDSAQDTELVAGLFDKTKLILSDDGKVTGLDEQLKTLKKEKSFLFKDDKSQTQIKGGKPAEGSGTPPSEKKTSEMTYSEMLQYLEANPGAKLE